MQRFTVLLAVALLAGSCAGSQDQATNDAPPTTSAPSVTATTQTTTTAATATPPPTQATGTEGAAGIGDPFYADLGNGGYDVAHYTLDLDLDPATNDLNAGVSIRAAATMDLSRFNLDFLGFEITSLLVDGAEAPFERSGAELIVTPPETINAGTEFTVEVAYQGRPRPIASRAIPFGVGWQSTPSGHTYVVAEPDAAHTWFPSNDHPRDKATFTFNITVPDAVIAAANGVLIETLPTASGATWVWEMDDPMAPYLATIVVGDFEIVNDKPSSEAAGLPIRNVLPSHLAAAPPVAVQRQGEMLAFLADRFGPYPFAVYGIAVVDNFPAALENQALSIFGSGAENNAAIIVHELAHQWFGDAVSTTTWEDIWLNEGFASYAEWLWIEAEQGPEALAVGIVAERNRLAAAQDSGTPLPPPGTPPPDDLFNVSVYRVGAMTLHALRLTVGDEAFFATLQTYFERYNGSTATTDDFIAIAEEVSGQQLDDLFAAWLYGDTIPEFP